MLVSKQRHLRVRFKGFLGKYTLLLIPRCLCCAVSHHGWYCAKCDRAAQLSTPGVGKYPALSLLCCAGCKAQCLLFARGFCFMHQVVKVKVTVCDVVCCSEPEITECTESLSLRTLASCYNCSPGPACYSDFTQEIRALWLQLSLKAEFGSPEPADALFLRSCSEWTLCR